MNEVIITDDQKKLLCYTIINLVLTVLLIIIASNFYTHNYYLSFLFAITGMWFSVKTMCKYGKCWIKKVPVCEFRDREVILHSLAEDDNTMQYGEIKEIKILKDKKSVKLFFAGDCVHHPSGWIYVGIVYLFKRKELEEVENKIKQCLDEHHVNYSVVDQTKK